MPPALSRPIDATLSVTKAARVLGVHPNTVRAWSDGGRLRYYRINSRGDRRYRLGDLQRFLALASHDAAVPDPSAHRLGFHLPLRASRTDAGSTALMMLARLGELAASAADPGHELADLLAEAAELIRAGGGYRSVSIDERRDGELIVRATVGVSAERVAYPAGTFVDRPRRGRRRQQAAAIDGDDGTWGRLLGVRDDPLPRTSSGREAERSLLDASARGVGAIVRAAARRSAADSRFRRSETLREVAADLGRRRRLDEVLDALVDHAVALFGADRAGVALQGAGEAEPPLAGRGLTRSELEALRTLPAGSLAAEAAGAGAPRAAVLGRDAAHTIRPSRAQDSSALAPQATAAAVPLLDGRDLIGVLEVRHDRQHHWDDDQLAALGALGEHGSVAIRTAQDHERMAGWAAQLQSIQQLGVRLNGLRTVAEIGQAIATELRQLIDYHNVRVYRLYGTDLVPVAMMGHIGVYVDETPEQLRSKLGEGVTGWVAEHREPVRIGDAAKDPRALTIPGTESDLEESMLLAPMIFEDSVLGVLVLSKLGLHQFRDDHLRLLVIYASLAAQAMANADATERLREQSAALERQLQGQRDLLGITESILTILDPSAVVEQIADRLAVLVGYDTMTIEILDAATLLLVPQTARGLDAERRLAPWTPGETGLSLWVLERNKPALVSGERDDPRLNPVRDAGAIQGSCIAVPLRDRAGGRGVLTLERAGSADAYTTDEFELVQLFAAQVSIALHNAEVYRAVEIRARTDALTGLLNHGTFVDRLAQAVKRGETFSVLMLDLDRFKRVNDELGHQAGDRLLGEIARALIAATRDADRVFRYGGDEFAILLAGTDAEGAASAAERVRSALLSVGGWGSEWRAHGILVTASIGIATFPEDGETAASVLLAADRACFVAKRSGRDRIATGREGLALGAAFTLQQPTPVDPPTPVHPSALLEPPILADPPTAIR